MSSSEPPFSVPAAWSLLRDALGWLANLFGAPEAVRAQEMLRRRDYDLLRGWVRSLEALASRLLLIAAAGLRVREQKSAARARAGRAIAARGWRARFRFDGAAPRPARAAHGLARGLAQARAPREALPSAGLAARFAALTRLAAHPSVYAAHAARRLARDCEVPRRVLEARLAPDLPFTPNVHAAGAFAAPLFADPLALDYMRDTS
ncbi:MAG: hypothetical protein AB7L65_00895 [Hyphomonadaceae bacterium]